MRKLSLLRIGAAAAIAATILAAESRESREARRATEWKVPEIFQALAVHGGSRIADIGAGDGFLALRLAPAVGPQGRVFAVDIDEQALERLRTRLAAAGAENVEVVKSTETDPLLAPASLDGAVVLRAYHEFTRYREMLAHIRAALKPGGRLVILDVEPAASDAGRERQFAQHVLARTLAEGDLKEAGFWILRSSPSFARLNNGETVWLIAATAA
jgi:ubiquinone/menaquinone biosynthesis C-methylase UbiE